jgi:hypothetical protein
MAAKILAAGDVVLDINIYKGGRLTPDSNEAGTRHAWLRALLAS